MRGTSGDVMTDKTKTVGEYQLREDFDHRGRLCVYVVQDGWRDGRGGVSTVLTADDIPGAEHLSMKTAVKIVERWIAAPPQADTTGKIIAWSGDAMGCAFRIEGGDLDGHRSTNRFNSKAAANRAGRLYLSGTPFDEIDGRGYAE